MTREEGMKRISKAIKEHFIIEDLGQLRRDNIIGSQEYQNLLDMIQSEDNRDFTFASLIIEKKLEDNDIKPTILNLTTGEYESYI